MLNKKHSIRHILCTRFAVPWVKVISLVDGLMLVRGLLISGGGGGGGGDSYWAMLKREHSGRTNVFVLLVLMLTLLLLAFSPCLCTLVWEAALTLSLPAVPRPKIESTTVKYCLTAFQWMVILKGSIESKVRALCITQGFTLGVKGLTKEHHSKVLLNSFPMNGHT